jgi:Flp pilus assembly protein TadG
MFFRQKKSSGKRRHSGAAIVELALTLSILFSICYGIIAFGYYFFVKNTMEDAVREGCRAGIVSGATITGTSGSNSVIESQLQLAGLVPNGTTASGGGPYTIGNYTITYTDSTTSTTVSNLSSMPIGDALTVTATASWGTVGQAFSYEGIIASSKVITTTCSMRKEGD